MSSETLVCGGSERLSTDAHMKKMLLLTVVTAVLLTLPAVCLDQSFTVDADVLHFVVANNTVYVVTGEKMYQLSADLSLVQRVTQRGNAVGRGDDVRFNRVAEGQRGSATFSVNVLLPFEKNGTVVSCGVIDEVCGYCEVLDSRNISSVLHREPILVGPSRARSASIAFLVDVQGFSRETYIMTAIQKPEAPPPGCSSRSEAAYLHNTNNGQIGGIFAIYSHSANPLFKSREKGMDFVDGFQIGHVIYLFSNVGDKVLLLWLEAMRSKYDTMKSMRGASLQVSGKLLASSVLDGGPRVLWVGVFNVEGEKHNTELLLFDVSADLTGGQDVDPDFCSLTCYSQIQTHSKILQPKATLFRQNNMTSVLAVSRKNWTVFYIGTGDGQLIKLAMDQMYRTACPKLLYNDNQQVFPKLYLDEVDRKHVFAMFGNQVRRVPVSNCGAHKNLEECWSARDPDCVWCGAQRSCVFEDECEGSDWVSLPDDYQKKMISFRVLKEGSGQLKLSVVTHLRAGPDALSNFACQLSNELCVGNIVRSQFPGCTCILSNSSIPDEGLAIAVKMRLGRTQLDERITVMSCTSISGPPTSDLCQQCLDAGCDWSPMGCTWATGRHVNETVCQWKEPIINVPKISSITPNVVSIYGKNNAVLSGSNLAGVIKVRIQGEGGCDPRESPVLKNTGGSLTFHIPRAEIKGVADVCVVLPDGGCYGNSQITYVSSPFCAEMTPQSTWMSGKRRITLRGSNLQFVEGLSVSPASQDVILPGSNEGQSLTFDTPAFTSSRQPFSGTLLLKVANESVACSMRIAYRADPTFISFASMRTGSNMLITIQKSADGLEMREEDLSVWGVQGGQVYRCIIKDHDGTGDREFLICEIHKAPTTDFQQLKIVYGDVTVQLQLPSSVCEIVMVFNIVGLLLILCLLVALIIYNCWKRRKRSTEISTTVHYSACRS